jgi:hypothetical protein
MAVRLGQRLVPQEQESQEREQHQPERVRERARREAWQPWEQQETEPAS